MTEIEQAIKYWEKFKQESVEMIAKGKDRNDILAKQVPMCDIALAALREKAARGKGCEYCNTTQNRYLTDDIYMATITNSYGDKQRILTSNNGMQYKTLGFCPMCGKRLEVEP